MTACAPVVKAVCHAEPQRDRQKRKSQDRVIGDEAAVHTDRQDLEGVVVDVEITDWPSATQNPRGRVIEILGEENDFGVDVEIIIRKFHLPHRFPPEVIEEAQAMYLQRPGNGPRFPPKPCATAATIASFPSSPSTAKPRAISTTPSTSANSKTATTNCKSTSPT